MHVASKRYVQHNLLAHSAFVHASVACQHDIVHWHQLIAIIVLVTTELLVPIVHSIAKTTWNFLKAAAYTVTSQV